MMLTEKQLKKLWSLINKREDGHWIWAGSNTARKYPRMSLNGTYEYVIRLMWAIEHYKGELDALETLTVKKLCNHRLCVNPEHLKGVINDVEY